MDSAHPMLTVREHGAWHEVQIEAPSLFEAAVRGLAVLKEHPCCGPQLQPATVLEVRPLSRLLGRVLMARLLRWLDGPVTPQTKSADTSSRCFCRETAVSRVADVVENARTDARFAHERVGSRGVA